MKQIWWLWKSWLLMISNNLLFYLLVFHHISCILLDTIMLPQLRGLLLSFFIQLDWLCIATSGYHSIYFCYPFCYLLRINFFALAYGYVFQSFSCTIVIHVSYWLCSCILGFDRVFIYLLWDVLLVSGKTLSVDFQTTRGRITGWNS